MAESRFEARMLCADLVQVFWKDRSSRARRSTAVLEDISQSGACLQLDTSIPLKTALRINCPKGEIKGVVRYCVFREIGYFVGLEFGPENRWSRRRFEPQHILDLRSLFARSLNRVTERHAQPVDPDHPALRPHEPGR